MQQFVASIRMSISTRNWFGALFMTLAMPDICAALEHGTTSGSLYKDWYNRYLNPEYNPDPITTREEFTRLRIKSNASPTGDISESAKEGIKKHVSDFSEAEFKSAIDSHNRSQAAWAFSANDCYKFRCKSLHQGLSEGFDGRKIQFSPPKQSAISIHRCVIGGIYTIDIAVFCRDMCRAVEQWLNDKANDVEIQRRISELMSLDIPIAGIGPNYQNF